jgi:two-component system OmpR family response regulator
VLVELTSGEFDILLAFLLHPQQILNRDQLLDLARGRVAGPLDRTIDVQVGRLRRKLEVDPKDPELIKTVRGGGYVLTAEVARR